MKPLKSIRTGTITKVKGKNKESGRTEEAKKEKISIRKTAKHS